MIQADTDERLLKLSPRGHNGLTVEADTRDVGAFLEAAGEPIRALTIDDLQGWVDTIEGAPAMSH